MNWWFLVIAVHLNVNLKNVERCFQSLININQSTVSLSVVDLLNALRSVRLIWRIRPEVEASANSWVGILNLRCFVKQKLIFCSVYWLSIWAAVYRQKYWINTSFWPSFCFCYFNLTERYTLIVVITAFSFTSWKHLLVEVWS